MSTRPDQSPPERPVASAADTYRADAERVHVATVRRGLWSPLCSNEWGWVAPLADPNYPGQVTCETCLYDLLYPAPKQSHDPAVEAS